MTSEMSLVTKAQSFVHGSACTLVLPGGLLAVSFVLLAYRGVTEEQHHLPLNGFLANILLQMLPLVALKAKIYTCADRLSLVPMVLVKTLLMHAVLGILRVVSALFDGRDIDRLVMAMDSGCLLASLCILKLEFGYSLSPMQWWEHQDVRNLIVLSLAAAVITEGYFTILPASWLSSKMQYYANKGIDLSKVLFTTANYIDIVAFMPVVWRLYQAEGEYEEYNVGTVVTSDAKRQVHMFFLFVVGFYMWDDVIDPVMTLLDEPIAMMAHAAHFVLLLDFAGFFSFQVGQPNTSNIKEHGEQLQGLLSQTDDDDHC